MSQKFELVILSPYPYNDIKNPTLPGYEAIFRKYLNRLGHNVIWVSPSNSESVCSQKILANEGMYIVPQLFTNSILSNIVSPILTPIKELKLLIDLHKKTKFDIVQAVDSISQGLIAIYFKKMYNTHYVFLYTFPYHQRSYKNLLRKLLSKIKYRLYIYILKQADLVVTISSRMESDLLEICEINTMSVPSGADLELFSPLEGEVNLIKKINLENAYTLIYIGTLDKLRRLDILIKAIAKAKNELNNKIYFKLLMVGDGNDKSNLQNLARNLGIEQNIIFTSQIPYAEIPLYIETADIAISPIPPLPIYKVSSPLKLFEYMSMGKPVIANREIFEQSEVITQSGGGVLVEFNVESFSDAIIELLSNIEVARTMGKQGREWIIKNRNYFDMASRVEKVYLEMMY